MTPEKWEKVKVLFEAALEQPAQRRLQYISDSNADEDLRKEVIRLLSNFSGAGGFMEEPAEGGFSPGPLRGRSDGGFFPADKVLAQRFKIIQFLAKGGMGEVYEAEDLELRERVAVKVVRPELLQDEMALQRFKREVHLAKKVTHPNVCRVFDLFRHQREATAKGASEDFTLVSMELLEGNTLAARIRGGARFTPEEALPIVSQIAGALDAAHQAGVVHRDLKPGNIILVQREGSGERRVVITDFGLAVRFGGDATVSGDVTGSRGILGTPAYMSPEQIEGRELSSASDIYAFGLVIYEMLTGTLPFSSETPLSMALRRVTEAAPSPRALTPNLNAQWESAVLRCLERDPAKRFRSAGDVVRAVKGDAIHDQAWKGASPYSPVRERQKHRIKAGVAAVLALSVVSGVAAWLLHARKAHALTDQDTIVLSDFDNKTGEAVFDDTLKQGLSVALRQSPFLNVLSESKVNATIKLMARDPKLPLTADVAREVCQRIGSKAYISGSIAALGKEYVLGLKAVNCETGDLLAEDLAAAPDKEKVLDALGNVAAKLRGELGESLATVKKFDVPLAQATTPSLEALRAYRLGGKAGQGAGNAAAAVPFFQRAIELDPTFAMAYAGLGGVYANLGENEKAAANTTKAFELSGRVSEWERLWIASSYYSFVTGELDKSLQTFQLWAEAYPRQAAAVGNVAHLSFQVGRYDEAFSAAQAVIRLEPDASGYNLLMASYMFLNRFGEAKTTAAEAESRHQDSSLSHVNLYMIAFVENNAEEMTRQVAAVKRYPGSEANMLSYEALSAAYVGKVRTAADLSRDAARTAQRDGNMEAAAGYLADAALQRALMGNTRLLNGDIAAALAISKGRDVKSTAALAYAFAGAAAKAEKLAGELDKDFPKDTSVQSIILPIVHALAALANGPKEKAIDILQATAPYELGNAGQLYPVYARGRSYLVGRNGLAAAAEFQKILEHRGVVPNTPIGALAHLGIARAYALQGDKAKAKAAYQEFLTLWKDADSDVPLLQEAKTEYAKLQ